MNKKSFIALFWGASASSQNLQICNFLRKENFFREDCDSLCGKMITKRMPFFEIISPLDSYKIQDIEKLENMLDFEGAESTHFFLLRNIELMGSAVANRLLKKLENLPKNIVILFTTNDSSKILETIFSRINIKIYCAENQESNYSNNPLFNFFCKENFCLQDSIELDNILKNEKINQTQSKELFDALLKNEIKKNEASKKIKIILELLKTIQPTNNSYLWKLFFLKLL